MASVVYRNRTGPLLRSSEGSRQAQQNNQPQRARKRRRRYSTTTTAIARTGRKVLIISGFMMQAVVLDTVLDARAHGYEVIIPVDACGGSSIRTEAAVLRQMEAAGANTTSVLRIGTKLSPNFSTERGKQMFAIVQGIKVA